VELPYLNLANRLARVYRHRRKWAKRTATSCFRIYDRDIADQPLIVDWYDGTVVAWAYQRTRNDTSAQDEAWLAQVQEAVTTALGISGENIFLKRRFRQKDRQEGDGQYHRLDQLQMTRTVQEQGLAFEVNLSDYLDTGLFLDHRPLRARVRDECAGKQVLNLFAYTGAFTVYARAGGASATTTIDMSNTYLEWATRNLALNGFQNDEKHIQIRADCVAYLDGPATASPAERFDIIICDPPTFSNSTSMDDSFAIQRDHRWLLERCHRLLRSGGTLYFSTNCRTFTLDAQSVDGFAVEDITAWSIPEDFRNRRIHHCWRMRKFP
jgi:23S rRNA (cytosine1962-C5)-methyltransferase